MRGRMEFVPRALGGRSILGDPRNAKKLNVKIKYRESFRPFALSVLAEECSQYFKHDTISPYMLIVQPVNEDRRKELPQNFNTLALVGVLHQQAAVYPQATASFQLVVVVS